MQRRLHVRERSAREDDLKSEGVSEVMRPEIGPASSLARGPVGLVVFVEGAHRLGDTGDSEGITLAINGGLTGPPDRIAHFGRARETFA